MTEFRFKMLENETLAEWISDIVPDMDQESINGAMTLYAHLKTMEDFLDEHPEISERFTEWLAEPYPEEYH